MSTPDPAGTPPHHRPAPPRRPRRRTAWRQPGLRRLHRRRRRRPRRSAAEALTTLLGPSGCGKTTTLRMLAGYSAPTSGTILIDGDDMTRTPPEKRGLGMVFQSYALFPHLSVAENVGYGLKLRRVPADERARRVAETLDLVGLGHLAASKPKKLSGGQQQRVALARAIAIRPKLLLLDEPLSNLDARLRVQMRAEIRRIQGETGLTVVLVTHDQDEALEMSDDMVLMRAGRIMQQGAPQSVFPAPANRFVADFLGYENFVSAADGTSLTVRPEHLVVEPTAGGAGRAAAPAAAGLHLPGTVTDVAYRGVDLLVTVAADRRLGRPRAARLRRARHGHVVARARRRRRRDRAAVAARRAGRLSRPATGAAPPPRPSLRPLPCPAPPAPLCPSSKGPPMIAAPPARGRLALAAGLAVSAVVLAGCSSGDAVVVRRREHRRQHVPVRRRGVPGGGGRPVHRGHRHRGRDRDRLERRPAVEAAARRRRPRHRRHADQRLLRGPRPGGRPVPAGRGGRRAEPARPSPTSRPRTPTSAPPTATSSTAPSTRPTSSTPTRPPTGRCTATPTSRAAWPCPTSR